MPEKTRGRLCHCEHPRPLRRPCKHPGVDMRSVTGTSGSAGRAARRHDAIRDKCRYGEELRASRAARAPMSARRSAHLASQRHAWQRARYWALPIATVAAATAIASHPARGPVKAMSRRDLLDERRLAVDEPSALFGRVRGREHLPSRDTSARCEVGCQMLTVGLPAQDEDPRRFQGQRAARIRALSPHRHEHHDHQPSGDQ